jgi:hypothetical protein
MGSGRPHENDQAPSPSSSASTPHPSVRRHPRSRAASAPFHYGTARCKPGHHLTGRRPLPADSGLSDERSRVLSCQGLPWGRRESARDAPWGCQVLKDIAARLILCVDGEAEVVVELCAGAPAAGHPAFVVTIPGEQEAMSGPRSRLGEFHVRVSILMATWRSTPLYMIS